MTQDEIIEMARQAGYQHPDAVGQCEDFEYFDLEAFAKLVADKEREACANEYQRWAKEYLANIKEALAQPEQEPVACIGYWNQKTGAYYKPDQISAAHKKLIDDGILRRCYTTPHKRTWVGLTDEDKQTAFDATQEGGGFWEFADAIEAKLKEKNNG